MLAPHFIQLLTSSRPAAIARIKPLVNTPFVFFFAVNTLRDTSGFFNMLLLIYGAGVILENLLLSNACEKRSADTVTLFFPWKLFAKNPSSPSTSSAVIFCSTTFPEKDP